MRMTRGPFLMLVAAVALVAGWNALQSAESEIAVLRTFDTEGQDFFTTVWVADDAHGYVWIRAHVPDRKWLATLRARSDVELRRDERSQRFAARVFEDGATRQTVARLFRDKYGLADRAREWISGPDAIPVRLRTR